MAYTFGKFSRAVAHKAGVEFLMALFYVYIGCGAYVGLEGNGLKSSQSQVVSIAFAFGLVTVGLGYVSDCTKHDYGNPAISVARALVGQASVVDTLVSVSAQIVGGLAGAGLLFASTDTLAESCNIVPSNMSEGEALLLEIILTFFVALVIFHSSEKNCSFSGSIMVGFAITAVHFVAVTQTRTGIHPARSFASAVATDRSVLSVAGVTLNHDCWDGHWVFWVGPGLGALAAALVHYCCCCDKAKCDKGKCCEKGKQCEKTAESSEGVALQYIPPSKQQAALSSATAV